MIHPRDAALAAALTAAAAAATACTPPPQVAGKVQYHCDAIHMPGNELGWCVDWTRPNGMKVTGPESRRQFEQDNPNAVTP